MQTNERKRPERFAGTGIRIDQGQWGLTELNCRWESLGVDVFGETGLDYELEYLFPSSTESNALLTSTCSLLTLFSSETMEFLSSKSHRPSPNTRDPRIWNSKVVLIYRLLTNTKCIKFALTKKIKLNRQRMYFAQHDPIS